MIQSTDYLNRPIFISGYHKSGTTLLLSILDGHPDLVVIPEELNFFKSVLYAKDKSAAIREKSGFKMFLSDEQPQQQEHWRTQYRDGYPEFDQKKFNLQTEIILRDSRSFKELLLEMVNAFAEVDHIDPATKTHWVSKTPMEDIYFPLMLRMFGKEFRFIYIVRDPRDVYTSISKWNKNRGKETDSSLNQVVQFCIYWQTRINKVLNYQAKFENAWVFRYEDLLLAPEGTLRQLCNFLQIDFSDILLQPTRHGKQWGGNSAYTQEFKGFSDEPIGRYQKNLDPKTTLIIEQLLRKELISFKYIDHDANQDSEESIQAVPWGTYRTASMKYNLRYLFNQSYIQFRYNFRQLH